jgi:hypothetical protein
VIGAGHGRNLQRLGEGDRVQLVAHRLHRVARRPDEANAVARAKALEGGVLGEEPIARVQGVAAGRGRGVDDGWRIEIARGGCRGPDAHHARGKARAEGLPVGARHAEHRLDAKLRARADDAHGDLAAVRHEHAPDVVGHAAACGSMSSSG